jgi:hypothetical protein
MKPPAPATSTGSATWLAGLEFPEVSAKVGRS